MQKQRASAEAPLIGTAKKMRAFRVMVLVSGGIISSIATIVSVAIAMPIDETGNQCTIAPVTEVAEATTQINYGTVINVTGCENDVSIDGRE